jgi:hypothetical protein
MGQDVGWFFVALVVVGGLLWAWRDQKASQEMADVLAHLSVSDQDVLAQASCILLEQRWRTLRGSTLATDVRAVQEFLAPWDWDRQIRRVREQGHALSEGKADTRALEPQRTHARESNARFSALTGNARFSAIHNGTVWLTRQSSRDCYVLVRHVQTSGGRAVCEHAIMRKTDAVRAAALQPGYVFTFEAQLVDGEFIDVAHVLSGGPV